MQREVDDRIKAVGGRNAYFPLFIPESYLKREADHDQALARREAAPPFGESLDQAREASLTGHAVTVRCLTRPDGSVPDRGDDSDDKPDLIAWVGRTY